jgi:hypothetical protein
MFFRDLQAGRNKVIKTELAGLLRFTSDKPETNLVAATPIIYQKP